MQNCDEINFGTRELNVQVPSQRETAFCLETTRRLHAPVPSMERTCVCRPQLYTHAQSRKFIKYTRLSPTAKLFYPRGRSAQKYSVIRIFVRAVKDTIKDNADFGRAFQNKLLPLFYVILDVRSRPYQRKYIRTPRFRLILSYLICSVFISFKL